MSKEARQLYGVTGVQTEATTVLVRPMPFDHNGKPDTLGRSTKLMVTRSWCLLDERSGKVGFVNTYDGGLGPNNQVNWRPESEIDAKKINKYEVATPEEIANAKWLKVVTLEAPVS